MLCSGVWRPECRLRPSRLERRCRLLVLLSCLCALPLSHAPAPVLLAAVPLALILARSLWRHQAGSLPLAVLKQLPDGWRLTLVSGEQCLAELAGPVRDWPGLLCLRFRVTAGEGSVAHGTCWQVLLWSDQLPAADWRRLRVSLRWRRREQAV